MVGLNCKKLYNEVAATEAMVAGFSMKKDRGHLQNLPKSAT